MPNTCPTCSLAHPDIKCAKCGYVADNHVLTKNLEPVGWGWMDDPRGPAEVELKGKIITMPRKLLICHTCKYGPDA